MTSQDGMPARIRQARLYGGFTQEKLSLILGCSPKTLSNWESSRSINPNVALLREFANETGASIAWLYHGEEPNAAAKDAENPRGKGPPDQSG